jgi:hypothetical protein
MYTISSAGLKSENLAAFSKTYRNAPPSTSALSRPGGGTPPALADMTEPAMEEPKKAQPSSIMAHGVADAAPVQPRRRNSAGAASMAPPVAKAEMVATSPM